jgi:abortive infection bacteriophage resistance protein
LGKENYSKPALSYNEQLERLKSRGLIVMNEAKASHYRLSGYWYPLLADKKNHIFKADATFEKGFDLYKFDREFRLLILRELEKIEVAVRSRLIYILSHENDPFWFLNKSLFKNEYSHSKSIKSLTKEYERCDEEFISAYKIKYSPDLPPSWMILEISSFGTLSILFSNLKPGRTKRNISKSFGLNDKVFSSWLHSIVYLRNVCAHHSRLWNKVMSIQPTEPRSTQFQWVENKTIDNNKSYFALCMILYLMQNINPKNSLSRRFKELLLKYPNIDTQAMGFPSDWESEPLWKEQ